ncbi:SDR family oxidoreductase [Streptomyces sp. NPDC018045]|uniref:SDR family oxidoreductase n=1 Tax=Streptomyces sp. NPDC018045 TaxID=3365037 RepID=UPI0037891ED2
MRRPRGSSWGAPVSWALELAPGGIASSAVSPAPTATEMFRRTRPIWQRGGAQGDRLDPARLDAPDDVAAAVSFLLSGGAGLITGHVLGIDGESTLGGR